MNPASTASLGAPLAAGASARPAAPDSAGLFDGAIGVSRRLRFPRLVLWLVVAIFAGLMYWAAHAEVDQVVRTSGRVVPSQKPQLVQHLEGGIVSRVFVHEGDVVRRGDNLLAISDLSASSSRGDKRAQLNGLLARAARLTAEANGAEHFAPPPGMSASAPEVVGQSEAFLARQGKLRESLKVIEQQLAQKHQEAAEVEARRKGLAAEEDVARQQLALVNNMIARNAASQLELLDARARADRLSTQIRETEMSLPRLASAARELETRAAEIQAQFRSEARSNLADVRVDLQRLQEDLRAEDDRVNRTVVTAPVAGTINKLLANTVGGVVRPGETLLELTPGEGQMLIEARASPSDRGSLQLGQTARLRVAAFDYTVYGTLAARVTEISADSLSDERGEHYFRVVLAVDPEALERFGRPLTPGMNVTADLVTGRRTIAQYLLSPLRGLAATAFRDRR